LSRFGLAQQLFINRWRSLAWYLGTFTVALGGPIWVYRLRWSDLKYPWRVVDSDLSSAYSLAQALSQSWFSLIHPSLGAPEKANLAHAFIPDDLLYAILRIFAHLLDSPIAAANLFYVFTFGTAAVAFLALATRSGLAKPLAASLAITYSWLPYHFTRMTDGHLFLASYFMLPIGVMVLMHLHSYVTGKRVAFLPASRSRKAAFIAAPVLVGSSGAYYGLFFALLAASTICLVDWRPLGRPLRMSAVTICTSALFVLAPILRNQWARRTGLYEVLTRSTDESLQFGGSLSRLFLPWGVWLPQSARASVAPTFFEWTATPLLGTIGVWLIVITLLRTIARHDRVTSAGPLHTYGFIGLLLYVTTGFGYIFALTVDSSFRTWNRLSIVIMTIALLLLGVCIQRLPTARILRGAAIPVLILMLAFATQLRPLDSVGIGAEPDQVSRSRFLELKKFGRVIERKIPEGCSILQLPLMLFPEGGMVGEVGNGNHLWLPLVTRGFHWSYGAPKGTAAGDYWKDLIASSPDAAVERARSLGFCAVVIDARSGIDPRSLEDAAQLTFVAKEKGGYWMYRIAE